MEKETSVFTPEEQKQLKKMLPKYTEADRKASEAHAAESVAGLNKSVKKEGKK